MDLVRAPGLLSRSIGAKHTTSLVLGGLGLVALATVSFVGITRMHENVDHLTRDDIATIRSATDLSLTIYQTEGAALRSAGPSGAGDERLDVTLSAVLLPQARQRLQVVESRIGNDPIAREYLTAIASELDNYARLHNRTGGSTEQAVAAIFGRMTTTTQQLRASLLTRVDVTSRRTEATYRTTRLWLLVVTLVNILLGLGAQLLINGLGPRIRRHAAFARQVADGRPVELAEIKGNDELAELGRALNSMVASTALSRRSEADQAEFVDTLQVTATEDEAHELVQRHLERSLPGATAVVLTRNNSENRLDAASSLRDGDLVGERLSGAEPRACLALRFGRTHSEDPSHPGLLSCALCGMRDIPSICEPLLVGGQVIGSVLVTPADLVTPEQEVLVRNTVAQAAPVLANLRNLALAEFRANNDSLTGLPNKRATEDTLKRMVAQANRSVLPLTVAMLDLDHFKQVNDRFGHAKGDEVLAAIGAALRSSLRGSDFAGRFGGEELLLLLPDTTAENARVLVERIRATVASIKVPEVDRQITVSIGVAELIQHSGDAPGLLRQADRALYIAKATGRNRVVVADSDAATGTAPADHPASDALPDARTAPAGRALNGRGTAAGAIPAGGATAAGRTPDDGRTPDEDRTPDEGRTPVAEVTSR